MSALHVGYVLKVYPRLSETFIVNEILELERRGVSVTIFSLRPPRDGRFHEKLGRVQAEVVYLPERGPADFLKALAQNRDRLAPVRAQLGDLFWCELERAGTPSVRSLANAVDLTAELGSRGVQHLHAHFATSATDVACSASLLSGVPFSFTAHAKDIYSDACDFARLRATMNDAQFVVTVCDANVAHLNAIADGDSQIRRVYNGLDLEDFQVTERAPGERFTMLGVGRLVSKKGFDVLVRACRLLRDRGLDFECRVAGDGVERDSLERLVAEQRLNDVVSLLGAVTNESVRREMERADLLVLPARVDPDGNRDALPTVLLEAMAVGLPFVSTPVTGISEIAGDEEGGILVPPEDPDSLATTVARLASSRPQRGHQGRRGRRRAEELFDIRKNVAALHALFNESAAASDDSPAAARGPLCTSSI